MPVRSFDYELDPILIGFGKPYAAPLQTDVIQGFETVLDLKTEAAIVEFNEFVESVRGRAVGFWFPNPMAAMEPIEWLDEQIFAVKDQKLRDTWNKRPDRNLFFFKKGETPRIGKIESVELNGGQEHVRLEEPLDQALDATWDVYRLQYVRFASDKGEAAFKGELRQERRIRLVELPAEYAAQELGLQDIYFYRFWLDTDPITNWRFTSFEQAIVSDGQTYIAKPITHGAINESGTGAGTVAIRTFYEANHPFSLFVPHPVAKRMRVQIFKAQFATPDIREVVFMGRVMSVSIDGDERVGNCSTAFSGDMKVPAYNIQSSCPKTFGDPRTCRADLSLHTVEAVIQKLAGINVRVTAAALNGKPLAYFVFGRVETGTGMNIETRNILRSNAGSNSKMILTLDLPFLHAVEGQSITVVRGCDGLSESCKARDNFLNWGGFRVPQQNFALKGMKREEANGNKK